MNKILCLAISDKNLIAFEYSGGIRVVEPHCYGISTAGNEVLRGYQIKGSSSSGEFVGWKLFSLKKISRIERLNENFFAPRDGYNPNDTGMSEIFCNL